VAQPGATLKTHFFLEQASMAGRARGNEPTCRLLPARCLPRKAQHPARGSRPRWTVAFGSRRMRAPRPPAIHTTIPPP
jgi:hypothetical protein